MGESQKEKNIKEISDEEKDFSTLLNEEEILDMLFTSPSRNNYTNHREIIKIILKTSEACEEILKRAKIYQDIEGNKISLPNIFRSLSKRMLTFVESDKGDYFSDEFKGELFRVSDEMDRYLLAFRRGNVITQEMATSFTSSSERLKELSISTLHGMEIKGGLKEKEDEFSFEDLFLVKTDDIEKIRGLVKNSINAVNVCIEINAKTKKKIIKNLEDALLNLENGSVSGFYGNVKEAIFILGAIGSLLGGVSAFFPDTVRKLQQSVDIVEQNSSKPKPIYILKNCLSDDLGSYQSFYPILDFAELNALPPSTNPSDEDNDDSNDQEEQF